MIADRRRLLQRTLLASGQNDPIHPADLVGWFKEVGHLDSGGAEADDAENIDTWTNYGTSGVNAVQTSDSVRPTNRTGANGINGLATVDFSGADYMTLADAHWPTVTAQTIMVVFQVQGALGANEINGIYNRYWTNGTRLDIRESAGADALNAKIYSGSAGGDIVESDTTEYTDEALTLVTVIRDGANTEMWINGTSVDAETTTAGSSYSNPPGVIGAEAANNNNPVDAWTRFLDGVTCEIRHWQRALTSAERTDQENRLTTKWGI